MQVCNCTELETSLTATLKIKSNGCLAGVNNLRELALVFEEPRASGPDLSKDVTVMFCDAEL